MWNVSDEKIEAHFLMGNSEINPGDDVLIDIFSIEYEQLNNECTETVDGDPTWEDYFFWNDMDLR